MWLFLLQLDVEDTPTILLYGGGALVSVWLLSAIVGAIDSIPVVMSLNSNSGEIRQKFDFYS